MEVKYKIVQAYHIDVLAEQVNGWIKAGWEVTGGLTAVVLADGVCEIYQAMINKNWIKQ